MNDLLFAGASRDEFAAVSEFLTRFAANTEDALEELRRTRAVQPMAALPNAPRLAAVNLKVTPPALTLR